MRLSWLIVAVCLVRWCVAADFQSDLKQRLNGKQIQLRLPNQGTTIHYDADGTPVELRIGPWTLNSLIEVEDVALSADRVRLTGKRLWLVREGKGPKLSPLTRTPAVTVEVALDPADTDHSRFKTAWKRMVIQSGESAASTLPEFWSEWVNNLVLHAPVDRAKDKPGVMHGGGAVKHPSVVKEKEPAFTQEARDLKFECASVFSGIVSLDGVLTDIQISKPCGLGLDEQAYGALMQWRFKPATQNGTPVPVFAKFEINFRLY